MKKLWNGALVALLAAVLLTGCGDKAEDSKQNGDSNQIAEEQIKAEALDIVLNNTDLNQYLKLVDYKNMNVTVSKPTVDEAQLEQLMCEVYLSSVDKEHGGITDRAVAVGDTVIIDYEGKKDGVAFAGGTAEGANLTIGSGQFIDGFEDGLIGVMPGETVDLDLTFPEAYHSEELAGQAVVFTVTVHYIIPASITIEEMDEEVIKLIDISGVTTVDEYRQFVHDYLLSAAESNYEMDLQEAILGALVDGTDFYNVPEGLLVNYEQKILNSLNQAGATNGVDADTYAAYVYGMNSQQVVDAYAEGSMKQELVLQAVANAEGLKVSDEELDQELNDYAASAGYASVEDLLGGISKEEYRNYFMTEKVMEFLKENVTITEN